MTRLARAVRALGALAMVVWPAVAAAQSAGGADQSTPSTSTVEFLPRSAFYMGAERLAHESPRYEWEANFGGELDLVDYGVGRFAFEANYQVVMGKEIRAFDPNQGNYSLAGLLSARRGRTEVAAVLYHQSRHLSDRDKQAPIGWNGIGAQVRRTESRGVTTLDLRADVRRMFLKSTVDYSWELDARARADAPLRPGVGVLASVGVRHVGVDGSRNRDGQTGYRAEGGVRLTGRGAAVELFVAAERRIDPYPLEFGTAHWVTAGFRLLGAPSGR